MPTDKRARQRAAREQKQAVIQKSRKRRRNTRRALGAGVLAVVIVGIVLLVNGSTTKSAKPPTTTTTTTATTTTTTTTATTTTVTTFPTPTTQPFATAAVATTCPPATGSKTRVVWFTTAPSACIPATSVWDATFKTSLGDILVQMPAAASFAAVNNFVFLARYQYFNGTYFHRVIPGFIVQGGDPTGTGYGGPHGLPGYHFTGNTPPASCKSKPTQAACYQPYDLVMANSGNATSDESQFFFVLPGGQKQLQPLYTIFGKAISGTSVLDKIGALGGAYPTGTPKVRVYLLSVTVSQVSG